MKIEVDRELCSGVAICASIAPQVFQLDHEAIAVVVNPEGADEKTILNAAQGCPLDAITLYDEAGQQIWPK